MAEPYLKMKDPIANPAFTGLTIRLKHRSGKKLSMKLIDDLISSVKENDAPVKNVTLGVSWTAVNAMYCGLAKTYGIPVKHGNYVTDMGNLTDKSSLELAGYAKSWNLTEASIGVAAINSMVAPKKEFLDLNADRFVLEKGKDKNVVMVGAFPFMDALKAVAKKMIVLELDPYQLDAKNGILPDSAAEYVIPDCDLLVITGSTLINKSMERLLALAQKSKAYTVVMGPSTVMSELLFDYGADMIAGAEVIIPDAIIRKINQSGGMINSKVCHGEIIFKVMQK
ncbi:MAG: DUF364 domain-containing protein [Dehalococcoidales bacterium]|nr:DUF364 domain-containing protein [Dehalococcoidales bacterium]